MKAAEIASAIRKGGFSIDELRIIQDAIKLSWRSEQSRGAAEFSPNDKVQFTDRMGRLIKGVVTGRTSKAVKVFAENGVNWKVAPSLLSKQGA